MAARDTDLVNGSPLPNEYYAAATKKTVTVQQMATSTQQAPDTRARAESTDWIQWTRRWWLKRRGS